MTLPRSIGALILAASTWWAACERTPDQKASCQKDGECGGGVACVVGACVPRITGAPQTWALEVLPRTESPWAATENPAVTFTSSDPAQLRVEGKQMITGEIRQIDPNLVNPSMRVLFSLPSAIGKVERTFETEARPTTDKSVLTFGIVVPVSAVGRAARITMFPAPPLDQSVPVWAVSLGTLGPSVALELPQSNDVWLIEGILQDETEQPKAGYVARALVGDRLVSNVVRTNAQGRFQIRVPNAPVNAVSLDQIRVELAPDAMTVAPRLETTVMAMKQNLGVLRLPPVPKPQLLDVPVTVQGRADRKLPGVTVRFSAELPNAFGGKAFFVREYQTDKEGIAHVVLLPGNAGATRNYAVAVLPPANSEFAARCVPAYAVAAVPAGQARVGASIELGNKLEVKGIVADGAGNPQSGVIMTATLVGPAGAQDCGPEKGVSASPATVTTGTDGSYRLLLDPGRYRIEYEPPMGSASTLFVEEDVMVDKAVQRPSLVLPSGVVATGLVKDDTGTGVIGAEVRIFGQPRAGRAPALRARTRTTGDGAFMIVLPSMP